jgi:hypothetical protein
LTVTDENVIPGIDAARAAPDLKPVPARVTASADVPCAIKLGPTAVTDRSATVSVNERVAAGLRPLIAVNVIGYRPRAAGGVCRFHPAVSLIHRRRSQTRESC